MPSVELLNSMDLDGKAQASKAEQLAQKHREAAVAAHGNDLAVGSSDRCADRLGQCVSHGPVAEGSQEPLIRLHPQIPRAPDVAHAGVVRENGVVRSEIANRGRDHLRAEPLATSHVIDVCLDPVDGRAGNECGQGDGSIAGRLVETHRQAAASRPDEIDLHDDRRRPG
jgi:hypothetical protein